MTSINLQKQAHSYKTHTQLHAHTHTCYKTHTQLHAHTHMHAQRQSQAHTETHTPQCVHTHTPHRCTPTPHRYTHTHHTRYTSTPKPHIQTSAYLHLPGGTGLPKGAVARRTHLQGEKAFDWLAVRVPEAHQWPQHNEHLSIPTEYLKSINTHNTMNKTYQLST